MASLKTALRRKNANGGYDTILLQGDSTITYRPSGRTVEQDLAAYLPSVQNSDVVPESLATGKLMTGKTKAWLGGLGQLATANMIPDLSNLDTGCKIAIGSYTGNGNCGPYATKNKLSFNFIPKLIIIQKWDNLPITFFVYDTSYSMVQDSSGTNTLILSGWGTSTITWYYNGTGYPKKQLNDNGETYNYLAFG